MSLALMEQIRQLRREMDVLSAAVQGVAGGASGLTDLLVALEKRVAALEEHKRPGRPRKDNGE
jgi:hypothetical protein